MCFLFFGDHQLHQPHALEHFCFPTKLLHGENPGTLQRGVSPWICTHSSAFWINLGEHWRSHIHGIRTFTHAYCTCTTPCTTHTCIIEKLRGYILYIFMCNMCVPEWLGYYMYVNLCTCSSKNIEKCKTTWNVEWRLHLVPAGNTEKKKSGSSCVERWAASAP